MMNLSDKDILKLVKDIKDTCKSVHGIVTGVRDLVQMFKRA